MRLAFILPQFPLGTQTFVMSDIAALAKRGHTVDVACLQASTRKARGLYALYNLSLHVTHFRATSLFAPLHRPCWFAKGLLLIWQHTRRNPRWLLISLLLLPRSVQMLLEWQKSKPDIVHAYWGHYPCLPLLMAQECLGLKTTMFLGAYDLNYYDYPLTKVALQRCPIVFSHAQWNVAKIIEREATTRDKIKVVYRGIPLDTLVDDGQTRKQPLRLCSVSQLHPLKNVDKVIKAFARLRHDTPEAELVICGEGTERAALERLSADLGLQQHVTFTGYLPRQEVFKVLLSSDIFIFLSEKLSDRLPNVIKEAMYARCAVIASPTFGIEELIPSQEHGVVLPNIEQSTIDAALRNLLARSDYRQTMGKTAYEYVRQYFSSDAAAQAYEKAWLSLR